MGGVDNADKMLPVYIAKYRSRKWYRHIFIHLLHLAVVGVWDIYQEAGGRENSLDF